MTSSRILIVDDEPAMLRSVERVLSSRYEVAIARTHVEALEQAGAFGPDLEFVASHNGLTPEEAVLRHAAVDYPIYMLGFTPGFPFLGGLDERLHTPRLHRTTVTRARGRRCPIASTVPMSLRRVFWTRRTAPRSMSSSFTRRPTTRTTPGINPSMTPMPTASPTMPCCAIRQAPSTVRGGSLHRAIGKQRSIRL